MVAEVMADYPCERPKSPSVQATALSYCHGFTPSAWTKGGEDLANRRIQAALQGGR
jgi:hypothetical protein